MIALSIASLAATWALGNLAVAAMQRRLIFKPPRLVRELVRGPHAGEFEVEALQLTVAPGVQLEGWRSMPVDGRAPRATVLYFGGRGEHVRWAPLMSMHSRDVSVVAFNHRGFGGSGGVSTEASVMADARAIHAHLQPTLRPGAPLIVMGRSLGTAVALRLAAAVQPDALILLSPFTRLGAVLRRNPLLIPATWLLRHRFEVEADARQIRCPTLVMLAVGDRSVANRLSERLARQIGAPTEVARIAGELHRSLPRCLPVQQRVAAFIDRVAPLRG
ncbi:MAG: alpha/beta hydrolase [Leptothrix sp. (in: b-proteobacteria)]